jgi:hypothetical protein
MKGRISGYDISVETTDHYSHSKKCALAGCDELISNGATFCAYHGARCREFKRKVVEGAAKKRELGKRVDAVIDDILSVDRDVRAIRRELGR